MSITELSNELQQSLKRDVALALAEDIGSGDISALLIDSDAQLSVRLLLREEAVLCGSAWFEETFRQCASAIEIEWFVMDGDLVAANTEICRISGPARALLSAERTALNFLQTLSGTATVTRSYVERIKHSTCRILDTRKTIPNLRLAQKYAIRCGGGSNHRIGLFDAFLIKENHLAACGGIKAAVEHGRALYPDLMLEVEVEDLEQLQQAIDAGVDRVLLDNFNLEQIKQAVALTGQSVELEASGNITDQTLVQIAETGVDFISVGALTKNLRAIDFSLRYL